MEKRTVRFVVSDLDGTDMDSTVSGLYRVRIICALEGIPYGDAEEKRMLSLWGHTVEIILEKGLLIGREQAERVAELWRRWDFAEPIPLVPGAREMLERNVEKGVPNILFSARKVESAYRATKMHGIDGLFVEIVGSDGTAKGRIPSGSIRFPKPDPRAFDPIVRYVESAFGGTKEEILFVGDTAIDVQCGLGAGIETLAVLTGLQDPSTFLSEGLSEENIIPSVAQLHAWIAAHRNGHAK